MVSSSSVATNAGSIRIIDVKKSVFSWTGRKLTGTHHGAIQAVMGNIVICDGSPCGGTVKMDMTSITNADLKKSEWREKLLSHLRSVDFFDVAKYPASQFTIKSCKREVEIKCIGSLEIKGVQHDATVVGHWADEHLKGSLIFDRSKYGIVFRSLLAPVGYAVDQLILDEVQIDFDIPMSVL